MDKIMSKYRFKTKEEFIRDGRWYYDSKTPYGWNGDGEMNHFMGQDVPSEFNRKCDESSYIRVDGLEFSPHDYVLKEGSFNYTGDKVMEVSDCGEFWRTRVVFGTKNGVYLAWSSADSLEKASEVSAVVEWKFAREVI